MDIKWTESALKNVQNKKLPENGRFCLRYETDGCGCGVNGVTELHYTEEIQANEERIETNAEPVFVDRHHQIYLDDSLIIDYSEQAGCFQLKSPNQFINPTMGLVINHPR